MSDVQAIADRREIEAVRGEPHATYGSMRES
jgi:hypothetical protein